MFNSKLKVELQQCQDQLLEQQGFFDAVHGNVTETVSNLAIGS
ncbi:MAG: hypothetical protein ACRAUW_04685 [Aeromonas sp.]